MKLYLYPLEAVIENKGTCDLAFVVPHPRYQTDLIRTLLAYKRVYLPKDLDLSQNPEVLSMLEQLLKYFPATKEELDNRLKQFEVNPSDKLTGFAANILKIMHRRIPKIIDGEFPNCDRFYLKRQTDDKFALYDRKNPENPCNSWESFDLWAFQVFGEKKKDEFFGEKQLELIKEKCPEYFSDTNKAVFDFVEQVDGTISIVPEGKGGHAFISYQDCRAAGMLAISRTEPADVKIHFWTNQSGGWLIPKRAPSISITLRGILFIPDPLSLSDNEGLDSPYAIITPSSTKTSVTRILASVSSLFSPKKEGRAVDSNVFPPVAFVKTNKAETDDVLFYETALSCIEESGDMVKGFLELLQDSGEVVRGTPFSDLASQASFASTPTTFDVEELDGLSPVKVYQSSNSLFQLADPPQVSSLGSHTKMTLDANEMPLNRRSSIVACKKSSLGLVADVASHTVGPGRLQSS